jgi:hypothetical protein
MEIHLSAIVFSHSKCQGYPFIQVSSGRDFRQMMAEAGFNADVHYFETLEVEEG